MRNLHKGYNYPNFTILGDYYPFLKFKGINFKKMTTVSSILDQNDFQQSNLKTNQN